MLKRPLRPKLVIFDCDGVLVDSEPIFNKALHGFLRALGAQLSLAQCCKLFTGKSRDAVEQYLTQQGLDIPPDWSARFYQQALEALEKDVTAIAGVDEMIAALARAKIPFCVASNGIPAKMQVTLQRTGLMPFFEGKIFSAYEVGQSKPAPDVFLHAAQVNGVACEDCLVVEDSPSGFEAAARAKMACFAYLPDGAASTHERFGAHPFQKMQHLPALLGLNTRSGEETKHDPEC